MKKRIIITGGNGQDGTILSKLLIKKKYSVYSFINNKKFIKNNFIKYHNINLLNYKLTSKIIKKIKPFAIIHLAAKNISFKSNKKMGYELFYKKNLQITKNLINSILENDKKIKFIFAGSSQMFKKSLKIADEKSKFEPNCFYSKYKIDAHHFMIKMKKKYKLLATTTILFNHDSKFRNSKFLLPRLANYLKNNKLRCIKKIYSQNIFGDFSHAEDICNGIFLLIKSNKNPDKIILSSNKLYRLNNLIDFGLRKFNFEKFTKVSNIKTISLIGNNKFSKKLLNWKIKKNSLIAFKEILNN